MLLGQGPVHPGDLSVPVNSLTGDLDALKNQVFVLKEGIEYKVKITFKVRVAAVGAGHVPAFQRRSLTFSFPQVNKEIVSGLKCLHHTYRRGLRGEAVWRAPPVWGRWVEGGF